MDAEPSEAITSDPLLCGDYEYLTEGYYACQDAEGRARRYAPTPEDVLDAYVVPIALERVRLAGLPTPEWSLTNGDFQPPAILYGVNPFARNHLVVGEGDAPATAARKASRQGKFVVCCQQLPAGAILTEFEQVFDRCIDEQYQAWAAALYRLFHLPLARVRLIVTPEQDFFSAMERLPRRDLSPASASLFEACLKERTKKRAPHRG